MPRVPCTCRSAGAHFKVLLLWADGGEACRLQQEGSGGVRGAHVHPEILPAGEDLPIPAESKNPSGDPRDQALPCPTGSEWRGALACLRGSPAGASSKPKPPCSRGCRGESSAPALLLAVLSFSGPAKSCSDFPAQPQFVPTPGTLLPCPHQRAPHLPAVQGLWDYPACHPVLTGKALLPWLRHRESPILLQQQDQGATPSKPMGSG